MKLNLAGRLWETTLRSPEAVVLHGDDVDLTCAQLWQSISACAAHLVGEGVGVGDRVALTLPNGPGFTVAYFATLAIGAVAVPLNPLLTATEVRRLLLHARPRVLIQRGVTGADTVEDDIPVVDVQGALKSAPEAIVPASVRNSDTAVILYTSGTTGEPKGVELTHENLRRNAEWVGESSLSGDRWGSHHTVLAALPLSHSFGQTCLQNAPLLHGASIVYLDGFDAEIALDLVSRKSVTILAAVPSMAQRILEAGTQNRVSPDTLQWCLIGGAPIEPELVDAFEAWSGATVLEGYGLSETSPVCVFRRPDTPRKAGSVGRAIDGVELALREKDGALLSCGGPGELVVRGHAVMKGYYRDLALTEQTIRDGWLATGDVARIDEAGLVYIVDRIKDVILRHGYTIYPSEVEEVFRQHPGVLDAAVAGIPDERVGEEILVFVARKDTTLSADRLLAYAADGIASYKLPRKVVFCDQIPRGAKGQVLRDILVGNLDTSPQGTIY
ncbi:MAG: long-chain-fatty-acid--CoA ligase [Gemmatimonadetes bacterium]|nr:long-chain-fatty-acid--CoA ligase [Gemmatimonadota bacterium]|tara:strand:+ start:1224 stop:2723 length:1500 start_codon:yes stop_codon:yes gene_type:complete